MTRHQLHQLTSTSRQTLLMTVVLAVMLAPLGAAPSAWAAPKGEFAVFADCPLSNAELSGCIRATTESGEVTLNKKTVPLGNPITLQGGFIEDRETGLMSFVGAADGNTLSKTPQTVPGGLLGVVAPGALPPFVRAIFNDFINKGVTGVTATTELAAPASAIGLNEINLIEAKGTALSLPVKIKLDNPFLGSSCYIGSNASPVMLDMTTGTTSPPPPNKPITGKVGVFVGSAEGAILTVSENSLVNNSFAAPGASGCGGLLSLLVDPAVNLQIGLPSVAGHNTAILNNTVKQAGAEAVREHE